MKTKLTVGMVVRIKKDPSNFMLDSGKLKTITKLLPDFQEQPACELDNGPGIWVLDDFERIGDTIPNVVIISEFTDMGQATKCITTRLYENEVSIRDLIEPVPFGCINIKENDIKQSPEIILRFHRVESIDVLIEALTQIRKHITGPEPNYPLAS